MHAAGSFALKRVYAFQLRRGQRTQHIQEAINAPVYVLPATQEARCPVYVETYYNEGRIPLPHKTFIIETLASSGSCVDVISTGAGDAYGRMISVVPFIYKDRRLGLEKNRTVVANLETKEVNGAFGDVPDEDAERMMNTVLDCICTIMHRGTRTIAQKVPLSHRRGCIGLATGWEYRMVEIPPGWTEVARGGLGGTHASPRWHIRRGHLRHLKGGLVVSVRECEVGDASRGGIVKDYEVPPACA